MAGSQSVMSRRVLRALVGKGKRSSGQCGGLNEAPNLCALRLARAAETRHNGSPHSPGHAMLRHLILTTVLVVLPASVARAQVTDITTGRPPGADYYTWGTFPSGYVRSRSPEDAGRDTEIELKYRETLQSKIPDRKPSSDPWKTIRPAPTASAVDRHRPQ
jgi:hypothetical protein